MATRFSETYDDIVAGLASDRFASDKTWQDIVRRSRKLVGAQGFDVGHVSVTDDLRKMIDKPEEKGATAADSLFAASGVVVSGNGSVGTIGREIAKRLGALKTLQHTYLLKRFGGHRAWVVSIPSGFTSWPCEALVGSVGSARTKLDDSTERFAHAHRKQLKDASQEALKWVHKAMTIAASPKTKTSAARIARWFSDSSSTDDDVVTAGASFNAGFKKIASKLKSGHLIYTDSVAERGTTANALTEAFVWGDKLDVVYIEKEFFGTQNTLTGLTNWARIVVHELTHREVQTKDHAYEHQGMAPAKISAAKAIENADSWAWFAADCAGCLTDAQIKNALGR